jgi:DNA-damage-inducible protein J
MRTELIQARISPDVKILSNEILQKIGLSISEAINIYLKKIIAVKGIPFDLKIPNEETLQAISDVKNKKNIHSYNSLEDLITEFSNEKPSQNKKVSKGFGINVKKRKKAK